MTRSYRDLIVWQRAMDLVPIIYRLLKSFPKEENYALADQIRRAVVSVPANIAEGQGRQHMKEFRQHLSIARGSLAELDTLLVISGRLGYLEETNHVEAERRMDEIRRMLFGLMDSLRDSTV